MAESDAESLSGGVDAAARTLEAHTPEMLSFEGIQQREEGYSATFTMAFENLDDYRNKINALLEVSEVPASDRDLNIEIDEQQLVSTLSFQESFYNDDLMGWAAEALIREEIVSGTATVLTSNGSATVVFDGEEVDTSTSLPRMNFTLTTDHRFADLGLNMDFIESGEFQITVNYLVSAESADVQNRFLDEQIAQLNDLDGLTEPVADSGAVDPAPSSSENRSISLQLATPEAVSAGIKLLLAQEDATFEAKEASDTDSPDVITQFIGTNWVCEAICDPNNLQQLDGETTYPEHWDLTEKRRDDGEFFVEFNRGMPLQEMTAATRLTFNGSMEQSFEFVVDNAAQEGHEDTVAERFAPPPNTGSFHTATQGSMTVYTTTFQAENAHELTNMINAYLEDKGVDTLASIEHEPLTGIWSSYELQVDLSPIWEVATGGVADTTVFSVELPAMHSGHTDDAESNERVIVMADSAGTFTVEANGPTITTVWVAFVTLLFLIVIVVLLFRTRKAATRVWGVPSAHSEPAKPYNVQGPKDQLTESQIYEAPLATGSYKLSTSQTHSPTGHDVTKPLEVTGPFPDVPVPSQVQYQQLQDRLRKKRTNTEATSSETDIADTNHETKPEDSSGDKAGEE